jgi:aspartyl-tRNA(Asn)/glutamyl-tRNA(Gln) amidotransferase subunit B
MTGDELSPKLVANWVTGEFFRLMNDMGMAITDVKVRPEHLAALIGMVKAGTINQPAAKATFGEMWKTGRPPQEIVEERSLTQISDADKLADVVRQVIAENPDAVAQFKAGKQTILRFLIGQVMKATRGKANPQLAEQLLNERLRADD